MFSFIKLTRVPSQFVPLIQTQVFSLYKHKSKPKYIGQSKLWGEKYFLLKDVTDEYVKNTLENDGFSMKEINFFYESLFKRAKVILNMEEKKEILFETEPFLYLLKPQYLVLPVWAASIMEGNVKLDPTIYVICQTVYVVFCKEYSKIKE